MAQRRSRNRRLSARKSNVSGFLNDDTNVYDNNDPLWYDRTAVRPSTSLRLSKHTTAVLDPDSTVHASQLSDDWFENLSQSESSKLLAEAVNKKTNEQNEEQGDSDRVSAATESESEHEFQKKRANLRSGKKPRLNIDKSNAFMKALEKTTDSHTRNLTHAGNQMLEGHESESTHDDSRTVMKLRPKFTRNAKNNTNNFDRALESDSASERLETSQRRLRSSKRISEMDEDFSTPEKHQRLRRSVAEKIDEVSHGNRSVEKLQNKSANKTKDNVNESSIRELRNRSIVKAAKSATPAELTGKSSSTKKRPPIDQSPGDSFSSPEVKKRKHSLFSEGNRSAAEKSRADRSAFEVALDSANDEEDDATITEAISTSRRNETNNTQEDEEDSDSSSIPQNIRRTRSRSLFGGRTSDAPGDLNTSKRESRVRETNSSKNLSRYSTDKSATNQSGASDKLETSRTSLTIDVNSSKRKSRARETNSSKNVSRYSKDKSATNQSGASNKLETSRTSLTTDVNSSKRKSRARETDSSKNVSRYSKDKSATNQSGASDKLETSRTSLTTDVNSSKRKSRAREMDSPKNVSQSLKDKLEGSQSSTSNQQEISRTNLTIAESSDEEEIYSTSFNKSKGTEHENSIRRQATKLQVSSIEFSDSDDLIDVSRSKIEQNKANASKKSKRFSDKVNKSTASKSTSSGNKSGDVSSSPELSNRKSRSRIFQKKNASKDENAFDQISFNESSAVTDKSKKKEIEDTTKLSQQSSRTTNKSRKSQSVNVSENKSSSQENTKNNSNEDVSEDETSTMAKHIRRTRSRLFQKSKTGNDDNAFEDALGAKNVSENRSGLSKNSRTLNKSPNKSKSIIRESVSVLKVSKSKPRIILDKILRPAQSKDLLANSSEENQENRQPNLQKSASNNSLNGDEPVSNTQSNNGPSGHSSVETSSDETPNPVSPLEASTPFPPPEMAAVSRGKRTSEKLSPAKSARNSTFDDLLHTPNPAQSTLNPHGKPVTRITQFSFRTLGDLEERTSPAASVATAVAEAPDTPVSLGENNDIDVTGDSDVSDYVLLTRQLNDIPYDKEKTTFDEDNEAPVISMSPKKNTQEVPTQKSNNNNEKESTIDWEKAKKHTDAVKVMVDAQLRLAEEARKKRELEKQRIDVKVKRLQALREAEQKRKTKKPIHKAFLVDGKVYKQPKLPRPKQWATNKLYNYLQKCMNPRFGIRTRVKSEKLVVQLSDFATRISKRKKFENYSAELDELMLTMAKLGIIETRYDFYRFCADFMPYSFRQKVIPMMMPGNERNIPYDQETLHKPLLTVSRRSQESDA